MKTNMRGFGLVAVLALGCRGPKPQMAALPAPQVTVTSDGSYRYIHSNGIPNHSTGEFPNDGCPVPLTAQAWSFRIPLKPHPADSFFAVGEYLLGVAVNGIPLDPKGPYWNKDARSGWLFDPTLDSLGPFFGVDTNGAHVQPTGRSGGAYHYHALPTGLLHQLARQRGGSQQPLQIGWAADGFAIYNQYCRSNAGVYEVQSGYRLRSGQRAIGEPAGPYNGVFEQDWYYTATTDLDAANGHALVGDTTGLGIYHYHVTASYPYQPRLLRGVPDSSFRHAGGGNANAEVPPALRDWPAQRVTAQ